MMKYLYAWGGGLVVGALCLISGAGLYMWVLLAMLSPRVSARAWLLFCGGVGSVVSLGIPMNAYVVFALFALTVAGMRSVLARYVYKPNFVLACLMGCGAHGVFSALCWLWNFLLVGADAVPLSEHIQRETSLLIPTGIALIVSLVVVRALFPISDKHITFEYYVGGRA